MKMSKAFMGFLCLLLSLFATVAPAQETANKASTENSLLWKIEGNGLKTSYLYGTFHILPQADFELKEKVKDHTK